MEYLIVVDANYLCYVEKYGLASGLQFKGSATGIIFGFFKHILWLANQFGTSNFAFCWDSKISFRRDIYPEYKSNRRNKETTEDERELDAIAYKQFDELRQWALPTFGFKKVFHVNGYESDDLIASIVLEDNQYNKIVVSSDQDLFQLLDKCTLYNIVKKQVYNKDNFRREFGITPKDWIQVKQIAGCKSDGVPGVKGVGEKKAIQLMTSELKKGKTYDKYVASKAIIERNRRLVALPFQGTPNFTTDICCPDQFCIKNFRLVCQTYGFNSILKNEREWIKAFRLK